MKALLVFFSLTLILLAQESAPYKNSKLDINKRVDDLLSRMTLEEKIDILGGTGFASKANTRLGIPELKMADGPVGVRWGEATAFPVGISMASTWNTNLIYQLGSALGRETKGKGRNVILGPCVNIARNPQGGRNFESFGEDPFLASKIAVDYIKGVQEQNVAATIKHFAANNQEHQRDFVNTIVSKRELNEIYFPAFKEGVINASVLCFMSSYNKVNGSYASENDYLLIDKLKKEWGFDGLVMSDWGAVHSSIATAKGGLDLEMPTGKFLNEKNLLPALKSGLINVQDIDSKVKRLLGVMFKLGLFDNPTNDDSSLINSEENRKIALETARESIVLLKNKNGILPLKIEKMKSIALIGPNANVIRTGGGGSSLVSPINPISPLKALMDKIGDKVKINFSAGVKLDGDANTIDAKYLFADKSSTIPGLNAEYYSNKNLLGESVKRIDSQVNFWWSGNSPVKEISQDNFSARWSGFIKAPKTGEYVLTISSDDGCRFYFDDKLIINDWNDHGVSASSAKVNMIEGKTYKINLEYYENVGDAVVMLGWRLPGEDLIKQAVDVAKNCDVAIVFAGTSQHFETEGRDREDLLLPNNQDSLIIKIASANPNTIIVLQSGSPVLMDSWLSKVNGVMQAWFPGVEGGNAIADILLGNINPSGKLPITFPHKWQDCSSFNSYKKIDSTTIYDDGIFVGYRHFDKNNIEPLFPFGFGLSYTTFHFQNLQVEIKPDGNFEASFDIINSGNMLGSEVSQLYISKENSKIIRAPKELKGFIKCELKPGEKSRAVINFKRNDFAFYDEAAHGWKVEEGKYKIMIGNSSKDIKLQSSMDIK